MNTYYDYTRKHSNDKNIEINEDKLLEIRDKIGCEPGEKCLFAEIEEIIKAALLSLPQSLRIVIILREYEGLSYEDISKITNTAVGTVKSRIARARFKLQKQLKEFI
jgi:RNA polymerase sigma-70 factor (ECF subfamily)